MAKSNDKMVANNKKAYHDYFILDKIETGIALHGTEVLQTIKRHIMIILFWIRSKQELLCTGQK